MANVERAKCLRLQHLVVQQFQRVHGRGEACDFGFGCALFVLVGGLHVGRHLFLVVSAGHQLVQFFERLLQLLLLLFHLLDLFVHLNETLQQ